MAISDLKACISDIPAALMAVSSLLSPRFPKVISDDSRMASGKACGTRIRLIYQKNCAITSTDNPLPMSSSTYLHRNCIISTNWQMKNVPMKSIPNCLDMKMSNFFILSIVLWYHRASLPNNGAKILQKIGSQKIFPSIYQVLSISTFPDALFVL